jgi:hypothetical protein
MAGPAKARSSVGWTPGRSSSFEKFTGPLDSRHRSARPVPNLAFCSRSPVDETRPAPPDMRPGNRHDPAPTVPPCADRGLSLERAPAVPRPGADGAPMRASRRRRGRAGECSIADVAAPSQVIATGLRTVPPPPGPDATCLAVSCACNATVGGDALCATGAVSRRPRAPARQTARREIPSAPPHSATQRAAQAPTRRLPRTRGRGATCGRVASFDRSPTPTAIVASTITARDTRAIPGSIR